MIRLFLNADTSQRLGCSPEGPTEVKRQKWFRGVDWGIVARREIPTPWVPKVRSNVDTQYFDNYPDSVDTPSIPNRAQQELFVNF